MNPKTKSTVSGCVTALVVLVTLLIAFATVVFCFIKRDQAKFDRHQRERRLEMIAAVQSGRGEATIHDPESLEMLVEDPECVQNVTYVVFSMTDLADPRFRRFSELVNVNHLAFYSCYNADNVMAVAKEMDSIEELYFEVTQISGQSLDRLAEFPNLKEVHFEQMVDDATVDRLRELLPEVKVETPHLWSEEQEL